MNISGYKNNISQNIITSITKTSQYHGISIPGDNNNISRNNISGAQVGLQIHGNHNNISLNNISGNIIGMNISGNNNNIILNNISINNMGISLNISSYFNNITRNNISNNYISGLQLLGYSNNITLNNISYNNIGVNISGYNNNISKNIITSNIIKTGVLHGIILLGAHNNISDNNISDSQIGLGIYGYNNNISRNNISNNTIGINISGFNNNISWNNICTNGFGIYCTASATNNLIYQNNMNMNTQQAHDSGTNQWDKGYIAGGNHWSDYDETSEGAYDEYNGPNQNIPGSDGIVDTPYTIPNIGNQDNYPLISWMNNPPSAEFIWSPSNPTDEDIICFNDLSYDDNGIVTWLWDFGDSNTSTESNPCHQYWDDGTYDVTLTITDEQGLNDTVLKTISVFNHPPHSKFVYSPLLPNVDEVINFIDQSTDKHMINSWIWIFDDGNASNDQNPTHQYTNSGRYHVTLQVSDDDGETDINAKLVLVDIDISPITSLSNGWNFISLPFNETFDKNDFIIKHDGYYYSWSDGIVNDFVFGWDRTGQFYTFIDNLIPGYGFWIFAYDPCELWIENATFIYDDYITNIENNWNIVSIPYNQSVDKIDILVDNIPWNTAVINGWINNFVFGWNRNGQYYTFSDTLIPGYAYWMYAYQPCKLKRIT
jgi:PKD repeat protein